MPSRTPLSNITNKLEESTKRDGRPYGGISKFKAPETTRNLFAPEDPPSADTQKYLQDDENGIP